MKSVSAALMIALVTLVMLVGGCGSTPDPKGTDEHVGTLQMKLVGTVAGVTYRLHGIFDVRAQPADNLVASVNADSAPDADVLSVSLPAGDYTVTLVPGWTMERVDTATTVAATLIFPVSGTQAVSIFANTTSLATFYFRIDGGVLGLGGQLDINISVAVCGDNAISPGESCDDGNAVGGDGCSATCLTEYHSFVVTPDGRHVGYATGVDNLSAPIAVPPTSGSAELVRTGTPASVDDACAPLPAGSLTGQIALVRRGTCTFVLKANNVAAAGAIGIVVYNHSPGVLTTLLDATVTIPFAFISDVQGLALDSFIAGGTVQHTWTADWVAVP